MINLICCLLLFDRTLSALLSELLMEIFEALHAEDLVSTESFIAWENCKDAAQQEGKGGVAIKSTIPFFNLLKEDESESSDDQE